MSLIPAEAGRICESEASLSYRETLSQKGGWWGGEEISKVIINNQNSQQILNK